MKDNNKKNIITALLIIIIISILVILFATNTINLNYLIQENSTNENNTAKYKEETFVGYYQILNHQFASSNPNPNLYIDFEIQLLEDGTAKVAYLLNDNGNKTTNQYNATYTLEETLPKESNGDYYKILKLEYTSSEILNDNIISKLSTNITYNPASNHDDASQALPKSLVMNDENDGYIITYMVNSNEIKLIK